MKPETKSFYEQAVRRMAERVAGSLDEALDLGALAREAALSPFHFHRIFRGMLGETPLELHRRLRLERAALALLAGEQSVTSVAFDAGYETHEAFTRAFRARYGQSPFEFRRDARRDAEGCARPAQAELAARSGIHYSADPSLPFGILILTGDNIMNGDIVERPQVRVATVRHVGAYSRISEAFERLGAIAGAAGLITGGAEMLALYHDDPETTPEDQLQSDAALSVATTTSLPLGLTEMTIPGGRYACTTFVGPYTELGDAWSRFMGEWLPRSGHRLGDGVSFEVYRNDPCDTAPKDLITELYIPVA